MRQPEIAETVPAPGDALVLTSLEIFDQALVFHTFADYMRDYLLDVRSTADQCTQIVGPIEVIAECR